MFLFPGWDILYLTICWGLTLTTSTLLTTIGPLAAKDLGVSDPLAPFTIGVFLLGAAASAVPSGELFRRYGRYLGFTGGCVCQILGSFLGGIGMVSKNPVLLYFGCALAGLGQGLGQFYRFAAVEISQDNLKSVAVTYVLSGGIFAAVLGPTLAKYSSQMLFVQYTGCFVIMGILGFLNWLTLSQVTFPKPSDEDTFDQSKIAIQEGRKLVDIVSQPLFILSCSIATIAHTVMVMIMSNCALSMSDEYSLGEASIVLEMHFLAMFAPGFVTGMLIKSYGPFKMSLVGTAIFALSSIIFALGTSLWNYYVGMILLGIAWNFSYSSATIMLTGCYQPNEAPHVQAVNDFILFSTSGVGCLISGIVFSYYSWAILIYSASVLMGFNFLLFFAAWNINSSQEIPFLNHAAEDDSNDPLLDHEIQQTRSESIDRVRQMSGA